jgi:hypothetical protein
MNLIAKPLHHDLDHDPITWDIFLDTGYTQHQVLDELTALDWDTARPCVMPNRYEMLNIPTTPALGAIQEYLRESKDTLIDMLYGASIYSYWSIDPEDMKRITVAGGMFVLDRPGFACPRHVDTRSLIGTGMLMFGAEDDVDQRTLFYRTQQDDDLYWQSSSKFQHGWFNATLHNTWHEGYNRSQVDRYAYLFHVSLKIF